MNCEEFKKMIDADSEASNEIDLEKHLEECKECNLWLQKNIEKAPNGFAKFKLMSAPMSALPTNIKPIKSEKEISHPSMLGSYLTGLKYGMVFGLSILCGLIIVSIMKDPALNLSSNTPQKIASFVNYENKIKNIPSFMDNNFYASINFLDEEENKLPSFLLDEYSEELDILKFEEDNYDG